MTAPPTTKAPPKEPPKPKSIAVQLPTMRVECGKCRHQSAQLTTPGRLIEVVTGCTCWHPEMALVLSFPGQDVRLPIEPTRRVDGE